MSLNGSEAVLAKVFAKLSEEDMRAVRVKMAREVQNHLLLRSTRLAAPDITERDVSLIVERWDLMLRTMQVVDHRPSIVDTLQPVQSPAAG